MFKNLAFRQVPLYCGCDGGSGGDANCGCGGSSDGGGDSDGDGLNDSFDSTPNGNDGGWSDGDLSDDEFAGPEGFVNSPDGYASMEVSDFTSNYDSNARAEVASREAQGRNYADIDDLITKSRDRGLLSDQESIEVADLSKDAEWEAADTLEEYANYVGRHHMGTMVGLLNPLAGMAVGTMQDIDRGYPGEYAVASNVVGPIAGSMMSAPAAKTAFSATGNKGLGIAAGMGTKAAVTQGVRSAAATPSATTSDESLAGVNDSASGDSTADETLQQIASVTDQGDPYADAGFGGFRNRQIRSRVSRPLLRG